MTILLICAGVVLFAAFFFACGYALRYCIEGIRRADAKLAELDPEGVYRERDR